MDKLISFASLGLKSLRILINKPFVLSLFFLCICAFLFSHEGHHHHAEEGLDQTASLESQSFEGGSKTWTEWIGGFHFIFLHFPLALITMTVISELLFAWYHFPIFDYSSRFMLISAATLAIPTALFGFIYSYTATYEGLMAGFIWGHMWTGFSIVIITILVTFIRERYGISKLYYSLLAFLFLLTNITGFLGGGMTFGPYHMIPP